MGELTLSIAMGDYDRTRPIADGRVKIDGVDPICMLLSPEEIFFRAFRHQAFDVSELSMSSYCLSVARGNAHYVGVPVFLSRAFRHGSIYVRTDAGIERPQDLKGKRIGLAEYQLTANVWVRGMLEQDYGVGPAEIAWIRGGMNTPGRPEKIDLDLPSTISVEAAPAGATLNRLLIDGEIDGFIGPRSPQCFAEGHPRVRRLFADPIDVASDYYARTGIFPIMHLLGVRRSLAEAHPWLPGALMKGFYEAKRIAQTALEDTSATKATLPLLDEHLSVVKRLMGANFWSYGFEENTAALDAFCEMHYRQGLSARRLNARALFHSSTFESYKL